MSAKHARRGRPRQQRRRADRGRPCSRVDHGAFSSSVGAGARRCTRMTVSPSRAGRSRSFRLPHPRGARPRRARAVADVPPPPVRARPDAADPRARHAARSPPDNQVFARARSIASSPPSGAWSMTCIRSSRRRTRTRTPRSNVMRWAAGRLLGSVARRPAPRPRCRISTAWTSGRAAARAHVSRRRHGACALRVGPDRHALPFAVARLHGAWTRGVSRSADGEDELTEFLMERVRAHGGDTRMNDRARAIVHKGGKVRGVVVDGDEAPTGVTFVVSDSPTARLRAELAPVSRRRRTSARRSSSLRARGSSRRSWCPEGYRCAARGRVVPSFRSRAAPSTCRSPRPRRTLGPPVAEALLDASTPT